MRRLLLICLACMAFVQLLPTAARAGHHPPSPCASCPMSSGHDAERGDHNCFGCSLEPDAIAVVAPAATPRAASARVRPVAEPSAHRPAFDPPPPRAVA